MAFIDIDFANGGSGGDISESVGAFAGTVKDATTVEFTNTTYIGGTNSYVLDVYCSDPECLIEEQTITGNKLTVIVKGETAVGKTFVCVAIKYA